MKIKNLLMAAAVATMALTACSNDEEMANVVDVSNTPINFTTGVNDLTAKTRAGYETGDLTSGSFGLFLTTGLKAGKAYTFNLTVGKNKLALGSVTVNEWGKGEAIADGDTEVEPAFPDEIFENILKGAPYNIPANAKGNIDPQNPATKTALEAIMQLDVHEENISDLSGIEYLTNLRKLQCQYNQLTSLDISKNILLSDLLCNDNQLTSLDLSKNIKLTGLSCHMNRLATLDITPLSLLSELYCFNQTSDGTISQQLKLT